MTSVEDCFALVEEDLNALRTIAAVGPEEIVAKVNETVGGAELVFFDWTGPMFVQPPNGNIVVLPIGDNGKPEVEIRLSVTDRLRLQQFGRKCFVGYLPGEPLPADRSNSLISIGAVQWFDVIDRNKGQFQLFDELHYNVAKQLKTAIMDVVLRGPLTVEHVRLAMRQRPVAQAFRLRVSGDTAYTNDGRRSDFVILRSSFEGEAAK